MKNGKSVTVVVELRARFDEEANIFWANKLQEEGAKIVYGVPRLKVHTKLFLIRRKEAGDVVSYVCVSTGNFNERTAKIYSDHSLLTADKRITSEVEKVFHFYDDNFKIGNFSGTSGGETLKLFKTSPCFRTTFPTICLITFSNTAMTSK